MKQSLTLSSRTRVIRNWNSSKREQEKIENGPAVAGWIGWAVVSFRWRARRVDAKRARRSTKAEEPRDLCWRDPRIDHNLCEKAPNDTRRRIVILKECAISDGVGVLVLSIASMMVEVGRPAQGTKTTIEYYDVNPSRTKWKDYQTYNKVR